MSSYFSANVFGLLGSGHPTAGGSIRPSYPVSGVIQLSFIVKNEDEWQSQAAKQSCTVFRHFTN